MFDVAGWRATGPHPNMRTGRFSTKLGNLFSVQKIRAFLLFGAVLGTVLGTRIGANFGAILNNS